jgi:hypothetical protein
MVKVDISEKYIRMCSLAKEIQHKWSYENGDYVYDTIDGDAGVWYWHHTKDVGECIWLPKQDQLQSFCIEFFIRIMGYSAYEAFIHFLGSYASWLKEVHNIIYYVGGGYKDVDSFEELMLEYTMEMLHGKKWGEENWIKAHKGYEPKPGSSLSVNRSY